METTTVFRDPPGSDPRIEAVQLPPQARMGALPRHFGPLSITVENAVYDVMGRLCAQYHGDYWEFYELSNGGFYMAPVGAAQYRMVCVGNGYEGVLSADAAGLAVCAMAYSQLSFWRDGARMADAYYLLRDYIAQHAERRALLALLD